MHDKILAILKDLQPSYSFEKNKNFITAGYLDSFDIVQLVAMLEEQFSVIISALDIVPENFASIESISNLVAKSAKRSLSNNES